MAVDGVELINLTEPITVDTTFGDGEIGLFIGSDGLFDITVNSVDKLTINSKMTVFQDKQVFKFLPDWEGNVQFGLNTVEHINVLWFGAQPFTGDPMIIPDDSTTAIQKAIDCAIASPGVSVVYFPPGQYRITRPLIALRQGGDTYPTFFNLTLTGNQQPFSPYGGRGVSVLKVMVDAGEDEEIPFVLGIQNCRGLTVKNLVFQGYMDTLDQNDLIYKSTEELYAPIKQHAPLCGIVIDPFHSTIVLAEQYEGLQAYYDIMHPEEHPDQNRGSSKVMIENCVIQDFPNGIVFSPTGGVLFPDGTLNTGAQQGDSIVVENSKISNVINAIVSCQTEARRLVVNNCDFSNMKFVFNGDQYGQKRGIIPEASNLKVAGGVAWLFRFNGSHSYGHFSHVYCEALYGIGYCVSNFQPLNFVSCVFKIRRMSDPIKGFVNPCILYGDNASMIGCTITIGGTEPEPLVMAVDKFTSLNCLWDTIPINIGDNLSDHFINTDFNHSVRSGKVDSNSWKDQPFSDFDNLSVHHDSLDQFYFDTPHTGIYSDVKKHFVFGHVKFNTIPFTADPLTGLPFETAPFYTCYGQVTQVDPSVVLGFDRVYFKNNVLNSAELPDTLKIVKPI